MTRAEVLAALSPVLTLACTVWAEARSEPLDGQIAVAEVALYRATHPGWWGKDVKGVLLKPAQFSCWTTKRPDQNAEAVLALAAAVVQFGIPHTAFERMVFVAELAMAGRLVGQTAEADHYCAVGVWRSSRPPAWTKGRGAAAVIGKHAFFRVGLDGKRR